MKRWKLLLIVALLILGHSMFAQSISKNALGIRGGNNDGFGLELSYQRFLKDNNRLEFGLSQKDRRDFNAYKLKGLYQWLYPMPGEFNWYAGIGASLGFLDYDTQFVNEDEIDSRMFFGGEGVLGIEYSFASKSIPILLSLDLNPRLELLNDYQNDRVNMGFAFGIRYLFN